MRVRMLHCELKWEMSDIIVFFSIPIEVSIIEMLLMNLD